MTQRARYAASVYETAAILATYPGPSRAPRYAIIKGLGWAPFYWVPGDTTTSDNVHVIGASGGSPGRWLRVFGASAVTATKTASYTASIGETVPADSSGGTLTVTLPTAVGNGGRDVVVKNVGATTTSIVIDGNASETIDGSESVSISADDGYYWLRSDNANWMVIGNG